MPCMPSLLEIVGGRQLCPSRSWAPCWLDSQGAGRPSTSPDSIQALLPADQSRDDGIDASNRMLDRGRRVYEGAG